jgi:hypothetical protein
VTKKGNFVSTNMKRSYNIFLKTDTYLSM